MIKSYKNKHLGETAYIMASGPSVKDFKPIEDGVYIGVNTSFFNCDIRDKLTYIILELYQGMPAGTLEDLRYDDKTVFTTYHDPHTILLTQDNLNEMKITMYDGASSITFYCFMFALYCGFSKIYLVGCDCSSGKCEDIPYTGGNYHSLVRGWTYIKEHLIPDDVKVIVLNPVNLLLFETINQTV